MDILFPDNKDNIKAYMGRVDCKITQKSRTVILNGEPVTVQAYRLPLHLVLYNTHNGRIASTYPELVESNGGKQLDASNPNDAKKLQKHLLSQKPEEDNTRTIASLKKNGQTDLAIITIDGVLLDGNRRLSCLSKLFEDTQDNKFGFIETAWLDQNINEHDRYVIELGISMGMDPKVEYGPIDQLIKLDQGIRMKISAKELASIMYGYTEKKVNEKLKKLEIMKTYLTQYYDNDEDFTPLTNLDTHFSEIQKIQNYKKYPDLETDEKQAIEDVAFRLLREGNFNHRRLRNVGKAVTGDLSLDKLVDSADKMEPFDKNNVVDTKIQIDFNDFEESVSVQEQQDQVIILVNKILTSLEYLDTTDLRLKEEEPKQKIISIKNKVAKLVSDVGV